MTDLTFAEVSDAQMNADATFVFRVDICILSIIAVVVLYRLPGSIALFGSQEWLNGHILRHVPYRPVRSPSRRVVQTSRSLRRPTSPPSPKGYPHRDGTSDESHTLANHQQNFQRVDAGGNPVAMEYPTHIASCPSFLRWTLSSLRTRITPTYSVGQFILLTSYFWVLVYATAFRNNLFVEYARVGWVAVSQLPFAVAYASKNNILGSLWGYGYEKVCALFSL
jgi:ferric-chelate reductase